MPKVENRAAEFWKKSFDLLIYYDFKFIECSYYYSGCLPITFNHHNFGFESNHVLLTNKDDGTKVYGYFDDHIIDRRQSRVRFGLKSKINPLIEKYIYLIIHRDDDLPAIKSTLFESYYKDGYLHREDDLPANIKYNEFEEYFKFGKRHRDGDLPALDVNGVKKYYKNGKVHRDGDQPAIISKHLIKYIKHGRIHREGDFPAIVLGNGICIYYKNFKIHRDDDLPAVVFPIGKMKYYKDGKLHRDGDKPAIVSSRGKMEYYNNGKFIKVDFVMRS